jgi:hypothetical protein
MSNLDPFALGALRFFDCALGLSGELCGFFIVQSPQEDRTVLV